MKACAYLLLFALLAARASALRGPFQKLEKNVIELFSESVRKSAAAGGKHACKDPEACPESFAMKPAAELLEMPAGFESAPKPMQAVSDEPSMDEIVQIGKAIWQVVEDNKGVINYKTDFTGAVPKPAVEDPFSMGGWINEDYKGWRWQLVNNFNSTVVDLTWAFKANAKGEYNGNGQFLNHVTTVLGDIYAAWGFSVAVEATAGQPYNAGTVGAPIAVQELQVTMKTTTALDSRIDNCRVRFFGDGRKPQCVECSLYC